MRVVAELSPEEKGAVRALVGAAAEADGVGPLSEQGRLRLKDEHTPDDDASHLLVHEGGALVGYGVVDETGAELVVDPHWRRQGHGTALLERAFAVGGVDLRVWAHGRTPGAVALAARAELAIVRELYRMTRPTSQALPAAEVPADVTIRTFRPGPDDAGFLAVNAKAFAHHPEQGTFGPADLAAREAEAWFDADGFFVAERDGRIVGFHWTKTDSPTTGEVYVVAVDPDEHGRGLGKALTLVGLHHLADRGLAEVELYVDGDNPAALALYRRLGFAEADVDVMYGKAAS